MLITDKDDMRETAKPAPFNLTGPDLPTKIKVGALVSVYESACAAGEILVKTNAERAHLNLPPEVQAQEVVQLRKLFDSREFGK